MLLLLIFDFAKGRTKRREEGRTKQRKERWVAEGRKDKTKCRKGRKKG
jgi:hypothetical protein